MRVSPAPMAVLVLGVLSMASGTGQNISAQTTQGNCTAISERDARILLYLIPNAFALRAKGDDVGIEHTRLAEEDHPAKYAFQLRGLKANPYGSTLLGNFTVDKCTGQVVKDDLNEVISSATLKGIQKIMTQTKDQ